MSSSSLVRWGLWGALLAATAWTASGIVAFVFGVAPFGPVGSLSWYLIESSDAIAEAGMLMALVGLHVLQVPNYRRLGMAGFIVAFVATASVFARATSLPGATPLDHRSVTWVNRAREGRSCYYAPALSHL